MNTKDLAINTELETPLRPNEERFEYHLESIYTKDFFKQFEKLIKKPIVKKGHSY